MKGAGLGGFPEASRKGGGAAGWPRGWRVISSSAGRVGRKALLFALVWTMASFIVFPIGRLIGSTFLSDPWKRWSLEELQSHYLVDAFKTWVIGVAVIALFASWRVFVDGRNSN